MAHIWAARSLHSPLTTDQLDLLEQHIITSILPVKERLLRQIHPAGVAAFRPSEAHGTGNGSYDSDQARSLLSAESKRGAAEDLGWRDLSTWSGTGCIGDNLEWREDHSRGLPMRRNVTVSRRKYTGLNHENNEANDCRIDVGQEQTPSKIRVTGRHAEGLSGAGAPDSVHYGGDICTDAEEIPRLARQLRQNLLPLLDQLEIGDFFDADGRCPSHYTGLSRDQTPPLGLDESSSTRDGSVESCDVQRRPAEPPGGGPIPPWSASVSRGTSIGEPPLLHTVLASDAREPLAVGEVGDARADDVSAPTNLDAVESLGVSRQEAGRPGTRVTSLGADERKKWIDASSKGIAPRSTSAARHVEDGRFARPASVCAARSQAKSTTEGGVDATAHPVWEIMRRCLTLGSPRPAKRRRSSQRLASSTLMREVRYQCGSSHRTSSSTATRPPCYLPIGQACPTSSKVQIPDADTQPFVPTKNMEHIAVLTETCTKVSHHPE